MAYGSSFAGVLVLVLISGGRWLAPSDAVSCMQAVEYLMPCQSFLMGFGSITTACCAGAQGLAKVTTSAADTKSACECLKQVAVWVNVNHDKAEQLPQLCNVKVPVPVQPDVNCDAYVYI